MTKVIALILALVIVATPAAAQLVGTDTVPGSSCAGFPDGATRVTADADLNGAEVVLVCDGANWIAASTPAASPDRGIQFNSGGSLTASGGLTISSAGDLIFTSGSLGIGTSTPNKQLAIHASGSSGPNIQVTNTSGGGSAFPGVDIFQYGGTGHPRIRITHAEGTLALPSATANTSRLGVIDFRGQGSTTGVYAASIEAIAAANFTDTSYPTYLSFNTAGASGGHTEKMRISSDGKVGIGTTAPTALIHAFNSTSTAVVIAESDVGGAVFEIDRGGFNTWGVLSYETAGTIEWGLGLMDGQTGFALWDSSGGNAVRLFVDATTGDVGIKNASPQAPLHVQGEAIFGKGTLSCTSARDGALRFTSATDLWEFCNGSAWVPFEHAAGGGSGFCAGPAGCEKIGQLCGDGTVFAGCTGKALMFTTPCDVGMAWDAQDGCTGSRTTYPWNNGNAADRTPTKAKSFRDGKANTAIIIATDSDSGTAGVQPHQAAQYCADLTAHGFTDWYLPAISELFLLAAHANQIGGFPIFDNSLYFWPSTECRVEWCDDDSALSVGHFWAVSYPYSDKDSAHYVRCVRNDGDATYANDGPCPDKYIKQGDRCYKRSNLYDDTIADESWDDAQAVCAADGADLATVNDATEFAWLSALAEGTSSVWIGYSDTATEGTWVWLDNTSTYTNWVAGEPDDGASYNCGIMWDGNGDAFIDSDCADLRPFICEKVAE